jgi:hypothetical protein
VTSFEKAWRLQAKRQQGDNIPQFCWEPKTLQYKQLCLLGEQYERLLTQFPRSQILTILIEDLKDSAKDVYERTLEFLDLPSDERVDFPIINPNDGHRLPWLAAQTWGSIPDKNKLSTVRRIVSMTRRVGLSDRPIWRIANKINRMNRRKEKRKPLAPAFHRELIDEFREDIMKLSRLVDRDLGHWLDSE